MSEKGLKKVIVALDLPSPRRIKTLAAALLPQVTMFKVGLITYTACGPEIISWIGKKGGRVFLDLKFFDIPNTMIEAAKLAVDMGVWGFTVHCRAGREALRALKGEVFDHARKKKIAQPLIAGVTELTSQKAPLSSVLKLARVAHESDLDAVVCSVWEARRIKEEFDLVTITPGIRSIKSDDQQRIATFADACREGADYCVVGRPIVKAEDPLAAACELVGNKKVLRK